MKMFPTKKKPWEEDWMLRKMKEAIGTHQFDSSSLWCIHENISHMRGFHGKRNLCKCWFTHFISSLESSDLWLLFLFNREIIHWFWQYNWKREYQSSLDGNDQFLMLISPINVGNESRNCFYALMLHFATSL
jgi:hypothetical protein